MTTTTPAEGQKGTVALRWGAVPCTIGPVLPGKDCLAHPGGDIHRVTMTDDIQSQDGKRTVTHHYAGQIWELCLACSKFEETE